MLSKWTAGNKRRDCNMRQVRETPK